MISNGVCFEDLYLFAIKQFTLFSSLYLVKKEQI